MAEFEYRQAQEIRDAPRVNLLVLRCRDLERSRSFYELLGFRFTAHAHGAGPTHYAYETPDFVFELYPAPSDDYVDQTGVGISTADLQQLHQQLAKAGVNPGSIKQNPWGTTFVVRDPDGRRVELKQHGIPPANDSPLESPP